MVATPAVSVVLEPDRRRDAGDGLLVLGRDVRRRGFGLLAVAERDPRLDVGDRTGALGPPAGRDPRADADRVGDCRSRPRAAARCRRRRAGSARTRTACRDACLPARGCATQVNACTVPRGPTSIQWSPVGRDRGARRRVVLRRRHEHPPVGELAPRARRPSRNPVRKRPMTGPDRAGVTARILDDVMSRKDVGQRFSFELDLVARRTAGRFTRVRSRGRALPSTGRAACASTACPVGSRGQLLA